MPASCVEASCRSSCVRTDGDASARLSLQRRAMASAPCSTRPAKTAVGFCRLFVAPVLVLPWISLFFGVDGQYSPQTNYGGEYCPPYCCHPMCTKCHLFDYNSEWHCLECQAGYDLWVDGCFLPCPDGKYRYGYDCQDCPANCKKCSGSLPHECNECEDGFMLDFRGLCVRSCGDNFYPDLNGEQCAACNEFCRTCIDQWELSCTSCYNQYYLRIVEPRTHSGQCMLECPLGYFRDAPQDLRCISCANLCGNCSSLDKCNECEPGGNLYRGICYTNSSASEREAVNFENYLKSGAGMQWNPDDAPHWEVLMGSQEAEFGFDVR